MANIIEKQFFSLKNTIEMTIRIIRGTGMAMRMTIGIMIGRWVRMMMSMDDLDHGHISLSRSLFKQ